MGRDHIVDEVRRVRHELAAKYDFDLHKIAEATRERQEKSGHKIVSLAKPSRKKIATPAKSSERSANGAKARKSRATETH